MTYNSAEQLASNWAAADIGHARWMVVDNASTDASADMARALGADVVELSANHGFSAANNIGLLQVDTPWTMFVNPDVSVANPADLGRLAALSCENDGALIAPQLLNPDGSEQANARGLPFLTAKVANRFRRRHSASANDYARTGLARPTYAAWVMGAAVGGPTSLFRALGGWDDCFFIYYEDHDLGLRAWESGARVVVDPTVRWLHEWQRATTRLSYTPWKHELRSMTSFYRRYPQFLSRRRFASSEDIGELETLLWKPAPAPSTDPRP